MTATDLEAEIERLKADVTGDVLIPADAGFEEARAVWNAAVTGQPLLVVLPEDTQERLVPGQWQPWKQNDF